MFTKTFTIACALLISTTAFAGPRTQLVKQLPTDSHAEALQFESEIFRLQGALATKHAQMDWARDYKHVSETEIFAIETLTEAVVTENEHSEGVTIRYERDTSLEHLGDVEVDARVADEYLDVLDEQRDALQARLELAEARRDLFLAKEIAEHVKSDFNVERFERRKMDAIEHYMDAFTEVTQAETAYRKAGGNYNVDPLITLEDQYELEQGTDDWDEERTLTLQ